MLWFAIEQTTTVWRIGSLGKPYGETTARIWRFWSDATKNGLVGSALYGPHHSIFFPSQNYHSQSIGSALWSSPFVYFAAFARKQPKCGLDPAGLAFRASQMHQTPIFSLYNVRLTVSDMLRSTPTMPSVWHLTTLWVRRPLWVNQLGQLSFPSLRGG